MNKAMNMDEKYREIVLGRIDELQGIIHHKLVDLKHAKYVRARLSEALTFAMQLDLILSIDATAVGVKADEKICQLFGLKHCGSIYDA